MKVAELISNFETKMNKLKDYIRQSDYELALKSLKNIEQWAETVRFYEYTGIPVTQQDFEDFVRKHLGLSKVPINRRKFNAIVSYVLFKAGYLPDKLPVCEFCHKNKTWINLGKIHSLQEFVKSQVCIQLLDNPNLVTEYLHSCADRACTNKYAQRKTREQLMQKYGVQNPNDVPGARSKKKEALKRSIGEKITEHLAKKQLKYGVGNLSGRDSILLARTRLKVADILGAVVYAKLTGKDKVDISSKPKTGYQKVIDVAKFTDKVVEVIRRFAEQSKQYDIPALTNMTKESYKQFTRTNKRSIEIYCRNCQTWFTRYVTKSFLTLVALPILLQDTYDIIFNCPTCTARSPVSSPLETKLTDKLRQVFADTTYTVETHMRVPRMSKRACEIDIAVVDENDKIVHAVELDGLYYHGHKDPDKWSTYIRQQIPVLGYIATNITSTEPLSIIPLAITEACTLLRHKTHYTAGYDYLVVPKTIYKEVFKTDVKIDFALNGKVSILYDGNQTLYDVYIHDFLTDTELAQLKMFLQQAFHTIATVHYRISMLTKLLAIPLVSLDGIGQQTISIGKHRLNVQYCIVHMYNT